MRTVFSCSRTAPPKLPNKTHTSTVCPYSLCLVLHDRIRVEFSVLWRPPAPAPASVKVLGWSARRSSDHSALGQRSMCRRVVRRTKYQFCTVLVLRCASTPQDPCRIRSAALSAPKALRPRVRVRKHPPQLRPLDSSATGRLQLL